MKTPRAQGWKLQVSAIYAYRLVHLGLFIPMLGLLHDAFGDSALQSEDDLH